MGDCLELLKSIVLQVCVEDHWVQKLHDSLCYTVSNAYNNITVMDVNTSSDNNYVVWLKEVRLKIYLCMTDLCNYLPTKGNLAQ